MLGDYYPVGLHEKPRQAQHAPSTIAPLTDIRMKGGGHYEEPEKEAALSYAAVMRA
ncbi:uncharacterized protein MYCFIDRAFT_172933 [Pseudocercospora fijiensis CIRAD86]|uniref:Uncharacterized protein n=1 Tax=Pseudocercospora fijiensis (strain CIRAD86) TaxID=383855 RepID=M2ZY36_PSEFD|nr:uncharacterized protein MYCFIDRAFT_172933 [Pseudocercospora fijiensis CIRAD86]EME83864.1 hypothetical protein MYCFIDRAFT_172933 [Pseudocercospora fijiensis CIRAD86]